MHHLYSIYNIVLLRDINPPKYKHETSTDTTQVLSSQFRSNRLIESNSLNYLCSKTLKPFNPFVSKFDVKNLRPVIRVRYTKIRQVAAPGVIFLFNRTTFVMRGKHNLLFDHLAKRILTKVHFTSVYP